MRKKDQSTKFIKICLADALIKLLDTGMPFDQINVKDICVTAGIGRTTYYRYFDNRDGKKNLLIIRFYIAWEEYCAKHPQEIQASRLQTMINFFYSEKDLLLLLHRNELTMSAVFSTIYDAIGPKGEDDKEKSYFKAFLACSLFGVLYHWIQTGLADPPEYISELVSRVYKD